jgi:hypothetical protein
MNFFHQNELTISPNNQLSHSQCSSVLKRQKNPESFAVSDWSVVITDRNRELNTDIETYLIIPIVLRGGAISQPPSKSNLVVRT